MFHLQLCDFISYHWAVCLANFLYAYAAAYCLIAIFHSSLLRVALSQLNEARPVIISIVRIINYRLI